MKKTILVFSLALTSLGMYAQEGATNAGYKTNGFWDNWFANAGGGASMYFGDTQQDEANLAERLTWGASASLGKWFSPLVGARFTVQGGRKHTFNEKGAASNPGHKMATGNYISAHADAMLNFSNLVAGYKENRFYNLIPYLGVGMAVDHKKINKYKSAVVAAGLLNTFRVTDGFAITLDISGQAVQSKFNDARFDTRTTKGIEKTTKGYNRQDWDGIGSVMLGFNFGLGGKQKFEKAETVTTVIDNTDNSLVDDLTRQLNDLSSENERLKNQLNNQKPVQAPAATVALNVPNPVQFEINSSTIEAKQEAVIYNVAEFLKNNSNTSVQIVGLADKKTGTPAYNKALSKKRAEAVESKLVKEYGISKNRISTSWKGDTEQPYPNNDWNRVVVITVTE
ncbi:OmpA family protein [Apibacter raozihei]|uniref:OmpA family protein n=1 Tax=Apibacter TaxID=1778601 RepID=UPI000FE3D8E3|nr:MULTISPECIES: OmpA family protein [Apibacter]